MQLPTNARVASLFLTLLLLTNWTNPDLAQISLPILECQVRNGLPSTAACLARSGDTLKIAYLGGSITQAEDGWRQQSVARITALFPRNPVTHINAGVGGTASDLGAFRLTHDVLRHRPNLIFIEFAVNDFKRNPVEVEQSIEGIVRQIRRSVPKADICLVYTVHLDSKPFVEKGEYSPTITAMEKVAAHYGIPSIHFGPAVCQLEREGKLVFKGKPADAKSGKILFTEDGVHPLKEGHTVYAGVVARLFPTLLRRGASRRKLPLPLRANNWERAQAYPINPNALQGEWARLTPGTDSLVRKYAPQMPVVWRSERAGASLTVHFRGTRIGIYDLIGPPTGRVLVQVDDRPAVPLLRFDRFCRFYRLHYVLLEELPDGEHTVKFSVDPEKPDKASILSLAPGQTLRAEYQPAVWMPAQLLLVGELIP